MLRTKYFKGWLLCGKENAAPKDAWWAYWTAQVETADSENADIVMFKIPKHDVAYMVTQIERLLQEKLNKG